jgi:hypothetical protein
MTMLLAHNRGISVTVGLEKLSEKGYEQRSEGAFGRYTEGKIGQIGPFRRSVELRCRHLQAFSDSFRRGVLRSSGVG